MLAHPNYSIILYLAIYIYLSNSVLVNWFKLGRPSRFFFVLVFKLILFRSCRTVIWPVWPSTFRRTWARCQCHRWTLLTYITTQTRHTKLWINREFSGWLVRVLVVNSVGRGGERLRVNPKHNLRLTGSGQD